MTSTLVVDAGSPDADSYISSALAATYHAAHGNDGWLDGDDAAWDQALRRATIFLDGRYRGDWKGRKTNIDKTGLGSPPAQSLAWPRCGVVDEEGDLIADSVIPRVLGYACAEVALQELASPGSMFPQIGQATKMEKVGPITVEYIPGSEPGVELTIVANLLDGLLIDGGSNSVTFFARA